MDHEAQTLLAGYLLETFHENTKYHPAALRQPLPVPRDARVDELPLEPFIALPAIAEAQTLGMSLQDAVIRRRSARMYLQQPMSQALLGRFLALCARQELFPSAEVFCGEQHNDVGRWLHMYAFLWGVEDLAEGTYRYDPQRHGLVQLGDQPTRAEIRRSVFQQEFCTGTGILLLVGDIAAALAAYGQRGYRYLLMQAGLVGETCYLVGTALGIAISGNGGLHETAAQAYGRFDGIGRDVVWSLPFGLLPPLPTAVETTTAAQG